MIPASLASSAAAQVPHARFGVNRFTPAVGPGNYLSTEGARVQGHLVGSAGLTLDYAHRPFVLYDATCSEVDPSDCSVDGTNTELVSYVAAAHIFGSLTIFDRLQIAIDVPLLLSSGDSFQTTVNGEAFSVQGGTFFVMGDPTLQLKARLYGEGEGIYFGASAFVTAPVGYQISSDSFLGDESIRVGGHLIAELVTSGFHLSANIGGFWRPEATFLSTTAGSAISYRVAIGYDVTPLLLLFAELDGQAGLNDELDQFPMEARLAATLRQGDFTITLAGGAGVLAGVGVPDFRALAGFTYAPMRSDRDGDGIDDADDSCPADPEDADGWEDEDGCPDLDNDGDGIDDSADPCPIEAEDLDGFEDGDGCPDVDNDADGVNDGFDGCPNDPEDMDGDRDEDGCPDDDTDRDGVDDVHDLCPNEPEDIDGYGDLDGCPEDDVDFDGIPDELDECGEEPELLNGIEDEDGCPEPDADGDGVVDAVDRCDGEPETYNDARDDDGCPDGSALVSLLEDQLVFEHPIGFRNDSRLDHRSERTVAALATFLQRYPRLFPISIEVHLDGEAGDAELIARSQARADLIVQALLAAGVNEGRLRAVGHGADQAATDSEVSNEHVEVVYTPPPPPPEPFTEPAAEDATESETAPATEGETPAAEEPAEEAEGGMVFEG